MILITSTIGCFWGIVIYVLWHLERRIQHLEHEVADLRASLNLPATTPEVTRRYDVIQTAQAEVAA